MNVAPAVPERVERAASAQRSRRLMQTTGTGRRAALSRVAWRAAALVMAIHGAGTLLFPPLLTGHITINPSPGSLLDVLDLAIVVLCAPLLTFSVETGIGSQVARLIGGAEVASAIVIFAMAQNCSSE